MASLFWGISQWIFPHCAVTKAAIDRAPPAPLSPSCHLVLRPARGLQERRRAESPVAGALVDDVPSMNDGGRVGRSGVLTRRVSVTPRRPSVSQA